MLPFVLWLFTASAADLVNTGKADSISQGPRIMGPHGELMTNAIAEMWPGVWKEATNGLRVQLICGTDPRSRNQWLAVSVGSVVLNAYANYYAPPSGKLAKFELRDANGVLVLPKKTAKLEGQFASRISVKDLPKWADGSLQYLPFWSNSPPARLKDFRISDVYLINTGGIYTFTVCPVIYQFETNRKYLDRIDLPCISTNMYLFPSLSD